MRLKPFAHCDESNLVFGKDHANGKGVMLAIDILDELDQNEAINDIGIDDLEVDASHTHTTASTPNRMECSSCQWIVIHCPIPPIGWNDRKLHHDTPSDDTY